MKLAVWKYSLAGFLAAVTVSSFAADWPAYRGPTYDGVSPEKIRLQWPAEGPRQIWKIATPLGFSSFTVGQGKAFTLVARQAGGSLREVCMAVDAATGRELWAVEVGPAKYQSGGDSGTPDNKGGDGPRSTPTVSEGKVYVYTPAMMLYCLEAATGKTLWTRDVMSQHRGRNIGWKSALSPVVDGQLVFVAGGGPGESILGVNKQTGDVLWKTQDEMITHSTPVVATIHGQRQVIFFMQSGLVSVRANDGKLLWRFPFKYNVSTAISPVVSGDTVYCSAGYDVGSGACQITVSGDEFKATELWKLRGNKPVANHWSTPVCKDGYLYGMFSFKEFGKGDLKCVELATGKVKWEQPGFGPGQVILVNDHVLALGDAGQLVLVKPTPEAYKEVARAKVVQGKCWSTPTVSNGRVFVRSTKEGVCLDVSPGMAASASVL